MGQRLTLQNNRPQKLGKRRFRNKNGKNAVGSGERVRNEDKPRNVLSLTICCIAFKTAFLIVHYKHMLFPSQENKWLSCRKASS